MFSKQGHAACTAYSKTKLVQLWVGKKFDKYLKHIQQAALCNNIKAQWELGEIYLRGSKYLSLSKDETKAIEWFSKAAELSGVEGMKTLSAKFLFMDESLGGWVQSTKWLRKAAELSDTPSQLKLGRRYEEGEGVPQDYVNVHMWYNLASMGGQLEAKKYRDEIANKMSSDILAKAQMKATKCFKAAFKNCN